MATRKLSAPVAEPNIVDVEDEAFKPGDKVKILGTRGRYSFVARRRNVKTGDEWCDLYGQPGGHRSVKPELVRKDRRKV